MLAEEHGLESAIQQWRALPAGDRKAILQRLPSDRRAAFLRLLAESGRGTSAQAERARRYHAYSPWLADVIEGCKNSTPAVQNLTPNVQAGLLAAHEKYTAQNGAVPERNFLSDLPGRMVRWLEGLR